MNINYWLEYNKYTHCSYKRYRKPEMTIEKYIYYKVTSRKFTSVWRLGGT